MKPTISLLVSVVFAAVSSHASANEADQTTIKITGHVAGPTPFISKISLTTSDASVVSAVKFTITPKPGTVSRPVSATYARSYLESRGYFHAQTGKFTVPVFGLYDGYSNTVALQFRFFDGSSKRATMKIDTEAFDDNCDFNNPTVRQARKPTAALSYDFILVGSRCGLHSPTVLDTDGNVRWVGTANVRSYTTRFYANGIYQADGARVLRIELDGTVSVLGDYSSVGARDLHHNIDVGRTGLIIDVNTDSYVESTNLEIDPFTGEVLHKWDLAEIISQAMTAGGDDPSGFVKHAQGRYDFEAPEDWFHNNSTTYRRFDDSLILSSRENFVICLDYDTSAIKWILGDTTKQWYQYPSLRQFALSVAEGGVAPVGQHAVSIGKDGTLLLFDNGRPSEHHFPAGPTREYSAPRKYKFDLPDKMVTEVWSFPNGESVYSPVCSSVYEDAPDNYLVDYATANSRARILGVTASGEHAFEYGYPTVKCDGAYRSLPLHWDHLVFSGPAQADSADVADQD